MGRASKLVSVEIMRELDPDTFIPAPSEKVRLMPRSPRAAPCGLIVILLLAAGCAGAPDRPNRGLAQVWGRVAGMPKAGAPSGADGMGAYEDDDAFVPHGARLVDYEKIGPVVVQLIGGQPGATGEPVAVTLSPGRFERGVYAAAAGGEVLIRNRSGKAYTVYALAGGETVFEVVIASGADSAPQAVGNHPGQLELFTYENENLTARLIVAAGPFAVVEGGARYVLTNVKPGKYTLQAWHVRLPAISREMTLAADQQTRIDLTFSVNKLPKVKR